MKKSNEFEEWFGNYLNKVSTMKGILVNTHVNCNECPFSPYVDKKNRAVPNRPCNGKDCKRFNSMDDFLLSVTALKKRMLDRQLTDTTREVIRRCNLITDRFIGQRGALTEDTLSRYNKKDKGELVAPLRWRNHLRSNYFITSDNEVYYSDEEDYIPLHKYINNGVAVVDLNINKNVLPVYAVPVNEAKKESFEYRPPKKVIPMPLPPEKTKKAVIATDKDGNETEYPSMYEAQKATGCHKANISACCRGRIQHTGGYKFRYREE